MGWNSLRRWPIAALLFAASWTSAAQQPAQQPSPAANPSAAPPSPAAQSSPDRVVITGMVPIPDVGPGAPRYTSADIAKIEQQSLDTAFQAYLDYERCSGIPKGYPQPPCNESALYFGEIVGIAACERDYANMAANMAGKAATVTGEAEAVRREAAAGRASASDVEAAELKRQDAVSKMQKAREKLDDARAAMGIAQEMALSGPQVGLDFYGEVRSRKKFQNRPGVFPGVRIEGVRTVLQRDKKESVLIQGTIRNTTAKTVEVPGLVAMLFDERDWVVARKSVTPDKKFVVAGNSSKPFGLQIEFAPQAMKRAIVAFAHESEPPPRIGVGAVCGAGAVATSLPPRTR